LPLTLHLPGGELTISRDANGGLELTGPAQVDGEGTLAWAHA
jgi:diaminopimelate epimerase